MSKKFKDTELKTLTFKELAEKVLKKDEVEFMLVASGYSGQIKNMNSYDAVNLFVKGINVNLQYWGNKYHILISKLVSHLKNNKAKLLLNANVNKVNNNNNCFDVFYNNNRIQGKTLFLLQNQHY